MSVEFLRVGLTGELSLGADSRLRILRVAQPALLHLGYFSSSDAGSVPILLAFLLKCPK